ncbi:MAG: FIST N-terminal domain-containing protein [Thermodesulfobacteriota bacterium]
MRWSSTASEAPRLEDAAREAAASLRRELGGARPDLVIAFPSDHHRTGHREIAAILADELGGGLLLGCTARSVIGGGREIEQSPALSLTAASLPEVGLTPFHLDLEALPEPGAPAEAWRRACGLDRGTDPHFLLLADPFSFDVERLIRGLDAAFPSGKKLGGVASGGRTPGDNALFLGERVHRAGLVGVALTGNIELDTIVAQGCRPIGVPMFVTRCRDNVLQELDGRPALEVLQELYESLSPEDQELCRGSLFLGIEMKQAQGEYQQGDFLIRNLLGSEQDEGTLIVGALLRPLQVVQFHLRDARTSAEDLERRLASYGAERGAESARGAVLFSCLGRGMHLYGRPNHDSDVLRRHLGDLALGGFFCNGEIGPVQGTTFLHGYTSAFGIFRRRG